MPPQTSTTDSPPTNERPLTPGSPPVEGRRARTRKLTKLKKQRHKAQRRIDQSLRDRAMKSIKSELNSQDSLAEPGVPISSARKRELRKKKQRRREMVSVYRIRGDNNNTRAQPLSRKLSEKYSENRIVLRPLLSLWDTASVDFPSRQLIHGQLQENGFVSMLLGTDTWGLKHILGRHLHHFTDYGVAPEGVSEYIRQHVTRQPVMFMSKHSAWYKLLKPNGEERPPQEKKDTMYLVVTFSGVPEEGGAYPIVTSYPARPKRLYMELRRNRALKKILNGTEILNDTEGSSRAMQVDTRLPKCPSNVKSSLVSRGIERSRIRRPIRAISKQPVLESRKAMPKLPIIKVVAKAGGTREIKTKPISTKTKPNPAAKPKLSIIKEFTKPGVAREMKIKLASIKTKSTPALEKPNPATTKQNPTPKSTPKTRKVKNLLNRKPHKAKASLDQKPEDTMAVSNPPNNALQTNIENSTTTTPKQPIHIFPKKDEPRQLSSFMTRRVKGLPEPISTVRRVKGLPGWKPERAPMTITNPHPEGPDSTIEASTTVSSAFKVKGPSHMVHRVKGLAKPEYKARRVEGLPGWELEASDKHATHSIREIAGMLTPRPPKTETPQEAPVPLETGKTSVATPQHPDPKPQKLQEPKMLTSVPQRPILTNPTTTSVSNQVRSLHLKSSVMGPTGKDIMAYILPALSRITCRLGPRRFF